MPWDNVYVHDKVFFEIEKSELLKKQVDSVCQCVLEDKNNTIKKMKGFHDLYRAKLNYERRAIFKEILVSGKKCLHLTQIIENHDYHKLKEGTQLSQLRELNPFLKDGSLVKEKPLKSSWATLKPWQTESKKKPIYYDQNKNNWYSLNEEQDTAIDEHMPLLVLGAAGSGKTTAAFLRVLRELHQATKDAPVYFIFPKKSLILDQLKEIAHHYCVENQLENHLKAMTLDEFMSDYDANWAKNKTSKADFIHWFKDFSSKDLKKIKITDHELDLIYNELIRLSLKQDDNQGKKKTLITNDALKPYIADIYEAYLRYLDQNHIIDPYFYSSKQNRLLEGVCFIDETQNLPPRLISLFDALFKSRVVYFLDGYQNSLNLISIAEQIKHHLYGGNIKIVQLPGSFRSPEIHQHFLAYLLKHLAKQSGGIDKIQKAPFHDNNVSSLHQGNIIWVDNDSHDETFKQLSKNIDFAQFNISDSTDDFPIYTVQNFKPEDLPGLEFRVVLIVNPFSLLPDNFELLQDHQKISFFQKKGEKNHQFDLIVKRLTVIFSRCYGDIYIAQPRSSNPKLQRLFDAFKHEITCIKQRLAEKNIVIEPIKMDPSRETLEAWQERREILSVVKPSEVIQTPIKKSETKKQKKIQKQKATALKNKESSFRLLFDLSKQEEGRSGKRSYEGLLNDALLSENQEKLALLLKDHTKLSNMLKLIVFYNLKLTESAYAFLLPLMDGFKCNWNDFTVTAMKLDIHSHHTNIDQLIECLNDIVLEVPKETFRNILITFFSRINTGHNNKHVIRAIFEAKKYPLLNAILLSLYDGFMIHTVNPRNLQMEFNPYDFYVVKNPKYKDDSAFKYTFSYEQSTIKSYGIPYDFPEFYFSEKPVLFRPILMRILDNEYRGPRFADLNIRDSENNTFLHHVLLSQYADKLSLAARLIEIGCHYHVPNKSGNTTAFELICREGDIKLVIRMIQLARIMNIQLPLYSAIYDMLKQDIVNVPLMQLLVREFDLTQETVFTEILKKIIPEALILNTDNVFINAVTLYPDIANQVRSKGYPILISTFLNEKTKDQLPFLINHGGIDLDAQNRFHCDIFSHIQSHYVLQLRLCIAGARSFGRDIIVKTKEEYQKLYEQYKGAQLATFSCSPEAYNILYDEYEQLMKSSVQWEQLICANGLIPIATLDDFKKSFIHHKSALEYLVRDQKLPFELSVEKLTNYVLTQSFKSQAFKNKMLEFRIFYSQGELSCFIRAYYWSLKLLEKSNDYQRGRYRIDESESDSDSEPYSVTHPYLDDSDTEIIEHHSDEESLDIYDFIDPPAEDPDVGLSFSLR